MLEYFIVPLCTGYLQIGVSSDRLYLRHLQKAKIMVDNSLCCTRGTKQVEFWGILNWWVYCFFYLSEDNIITLFIIPVWVS